MKKKVAARKTTRSATSRKASPHSAVLVQRIIIITSCVVLALVGVLFLSKPNITSQSVAGLSITKGLFSQATIGIPEVDGAVSFNIYYKKSSDNAYDNAVRNIPSTTKEYTISYLKRGEAYDHRIVAVDAHGSEFWFSPSRPVLEIVPME